MSWTGYVPKEVLDRWYDDLTMEKHIYEYGMGRKHNGDDSHIIGLFLKIDNLQKDLVFAREEIANQARYFNNALRIIKK